MVQSSQDDRKIIDKYPFGDSLDFLRDRLKEADSSASTATATITFQNATSRLLLILMGHEAAFNLKARTSNGNLASELSQVFGRIQSSAFNYDYFRPLSLSILN